MSYSTDISGLSPTHHWKFDGDYTDSIGSADGTNSGCIVTDSAITKDATNCMTTNATSDSLAIPSTTDINNSDQSRKTIAGWFEVTNIQTPPKRIYGEGTYTKVFQFMFFCKVTRDSSLIR